MTSKERRESRYQRRVAARTEKRLRKAPLAGDYDAVFSFPNLWQSYKYCRRNVSWKGSVQRYIFSAPIRVSSTHATLKARRYKCVAPHEWDTYERGKPRHIKSVPIGERVVQRCLADNCLIPTIKPMLVYDNGACLEDKGHEFAFRRLIAHLHQHYRHYGNEGYILIYDFSKYYENIDHSLVRSILHKRISDPYLLRMVDQILGTFGTRGLALGSQISQILALVSANAVDHLIKQDLQIEYAARYNDDSYLIHQSKEYLQECLVQIRRLCADLHIKLNEKKTQIVKISHGFKFLKARVFLTATGKVLMKAPKEGIAVRRRQLKKLLCKLQSGLIDFPHIFASYEAYRANALLNFSAARTIETMDKLFMSLFPQARRYYAIFQVHGSGRRYRRYHKSRRRQILRQIQMRAPLRSAG